MCDKPLDIKELMDITKALKHLYEIDLKTLAVAGDGGTICFELIDSENEVHLLFLDKRIKSKTINHFYANQYPNKPGSIHLGVNLELLNRIHLNIQ